MIVGLDRILEGLIATLRADVIPQVTDPYARGQAVGVIDLLNAIAPRLEWRQVQLRDGIARRRAVIAAVAQHLPDAPRPAPAPLPEDAAQQAEDLTALRDDLDTAICDLVALAFAPDTRGDTAAARAVLRAHMNEDAQAEMRLTRKPLFAEIATGG